MIEFEPSTRRSSILLGQRHTTTFNRVTAKAIDLTLIAAVYFIAQAIWWPMGGITAAIFAAVQDALGQGQSVGKRVIGLRVIEDQSGLPCSTFQSFLRNFPLVVLILFCQVPVIWAFSLFLSLPLLSLELYLVFVADSGVRLGDVMGNTLVVEFGSEKIVAS